MPRSSGATNLRTLEFIQQFEELKKKHGDPVECLFRLMKSRKQTIQIQAASKLMEYRYPKLAAAHITTDQPTQLSLGWEESGFTIEAEALPDERVVKQIEELASVNSA